ASLRRAGLVNGKRGAGGGYLLARDPAKITAGDIVRALEGPIEPQICTAEGDPVLNCVREQSCGTRTVWLRLQSSIAAALDGIDLLKLPVDARARAGVFLAFQYPSAIPGVSVANFLRTAINARRASPAPDGSGEMKKNDMPIPQFRKLLAEKMKLLQIDDSFITRSVNDGFSGGEKKRLEILQMHMFQPRFAIL